MPAEPRSDRDRAILSLIEARPLGTQAALVEALRANDFQVTQATVSRDIRRLGLVKAPLPSGGYRYAAPADLKKAPGSFSLRSFLVGSASVEAFHALKTLPGRAMAVAAAIDELDLRGVTGTLAGDDLVLVLIERNSDKKRVLETLDSIS